MRIWTAPARLGARMGAGLARRYPRGSPLVIFGGTVVWGIVATVLVVTTGSALQIGCMAILWAVGALGNARFWRQIRRQAWSSKRERNAFSYRFSYALVIVPLIVVVVLAHLSVIVAMGALGGGIMLVELSMRVRSARPSLPQIEPPVR
jgi:hypothetical protein